MMGVPQGSVLRTISMFGIYVCYSFRLTEYKYFNNGYLENNREMLQKPLH